MREDSLGVGVKFHDRAIFQLFLKWVIYNCASLVMLDLDRRFRSGPIARPFDMSRYYILLPLEPFEADHSSSAALSFAALYAPLSELIHLLASNGRLC